jgi:hypothetical protein
MENMRFLDWLLSETPKPAHRELTKDEKFDNKENRRIRKLIDEKKNKK